ncbi:MAG TPA: alpha-galactosidase [Tepidisphaeraceae bacterium]|jgi:alpha-galactosidase
MTRQTLTMLLTLLALGPWCLGDSVPATKPRLAATPPMGWNSWEAFRKDFDEEALKAQADAMVQLGLRDAGYAYFVIDGGWKTSDRDPAGSLVVDPKKFPHGMKALADYLHERGLKLGLHQPAGVKDCGHDEPGSQGNEERDAALFASWGVDLIKYDQCDFVHDPQRTPGAPDLDKVVVRRANQVVFDSEAEAPQNRLTGLVRIEDRPRCSGGKCVAGIGYADGGVEIPDVSVPESGRYTLDVGFAYPYYGQNRDRFKQMTLFVSLNGGPRQRIDIPYAIPKRYTTGTVSIDVDLNQGNNVILLDNPLSQEEDVRLAYVKMATALQRTGRPILFSTSGAPRPWLWAGPIAHLWRTSDDISNQWKASILATVDRQAETLPYAGPGFWADPDMLEVGTKPHRAPRGSRTSAMTVTEQWSQFSLWAIMNAPLFISTDLRHLSDESKSILINREVIAINQDPLGVAGQRIRNEGDVQVFAKRLTDGEAVALLNRGDAPAEIRVTTAELGFDKSAFEARDLWTGDSQPITDGVIRATVEPHGVAMLRMHTDGHR